MNKRKIKTKKAPHRYFLVDLCKDGDTNIIVFKNGIDGTGRAYFEDSVAENAWWHFFEMEHLDAIEIPAKLLKKVARL